MRKQVTTWMVQDRNLFARMGGWANEDGVETGLAGGMDGSRGGVEDARTLGTAESLTG